jgi:PAS domain S-box-containing protein
MRLRAILLQLTMLTFLSALIGVYVHYTSLRNEFLQSSEERAGALAGRLQAHLSGYLAEQLKPARALAGLQEMRSAVLTGTPSALAAANRVLDHFQGALGVDVCYLMDGAGTTIASSNRGAPDSFVGENFSFRPYFQQAMRSIPGTYLALGTTSRKRGVYYSFPVHDDQRLTPVGVAVVKAPVDPIEERMERVEGATALLVDPHGIVFIASAPEWRFQSMRRLTPEEEAGLRATQQFGEGPWQWAGIRQTGDNRASGPGGEAYWLQQLPVDRFPGWQMVLLLSSQYDYLAYLKPFFSRNRPLVLPLLVLICIFVTVLYRKANSEVSQRRLAEAALRANEERFRSLYHQTPALLHSIDSSSRLVSVSKYWTEVLGYTREEVEGRSITEFMSEASRRHAEAVVIPEFLRSGFCKQVPYQFRKKNGEPIDVLLSATAERDDDGQITRSLAVLVDVTEQKRAERRLRSAQELLRSHSEELERQVRERTLEITNILKYTPALVSLKDRAGRYLLVNSRFADLFRVGAEAARGKTDAELFATEVARRLSAHDQDVAQAGTPFSVEEAIPQNGGVHTYLSVKFPLFDDQGGVDGVGSISTDVTALKEAQEQLRRLSGRILAGEERERSAIARELHDELGQILTALRMDAVWLRRRLADGDSRAAQRAAEMCGTIDRTIDEVRNMVMRLRPGVLDDLGLVAAVEWVSGEFERRTGVACTFRHDGVPPVEDDAATATYRIAQETLTNVARHAGASQVEVTLAGTGEELVLTVHDDGDGFATDRLAEADGHGVAGIRERASLVGGRVAIESAVGGGTTVSFRLPYDRLTPREAVP